uniref:Uncharacterized protein n=1 Tax=Pipistrellus kuhlii TaxID=59472 RepID=A0A7J7VBT4_PIPKU|nr:hypothetical protein mPipKuh1_008482 [Pipistrellus kuhlii]
MSLSQHLEARQAHPYVFTCSLVTYLSNPIPSMWICSISHSSGFQTPGNLHGIEGGSVCVCVCVCMHTHVLDNIFYFGGVTLRSSWHYMRELCDEKPQIQGKQRKECPIKALLSLRCLSNRRRD